MEERLEVALHPVLAPEAKDSKGEGVCLSSSVFGGGGGGGVWQVRLFRGLGTWVWKCRALGKAAAADAQRHGMRNFT